MTSLVFDMDDTLTPNKLPMDPDFAKWFANFQQSRNTYLVTGSNMDAVKFQMPVDVINGFKTIFTHCGNEAWTPGDQLMYRNEWSPPDDLMVSVIKQLQSVRSNFTIPEPDGSWSPPDNITVRPGMLTCSPLNKHATPEMVAEFVYYDRYTSSRRNIREYILDNFPDIDVMIGGQIGMYIYPMGNDKSQVLRHIEERPLVFFGDRTFSGQLDYPLASVADMTHQVDNWEDTKERLSLFV